MDARLRKIVNKINSRKPSRTIIQPITKPLFTSVYNPKISGILSNAAVRDIERRKGRIEGISLATDQFSQIIGDEISDIIIGLGLDMPEQPTSYSAESMANYYSDLMAIISEARVSLETQGTDLARKHLEIIGNARQNIDDELKFVAGSTKEREAKIAEINDLEINRMKAEYDTALLDLAEQQYTYELGMIRLMDTHTLGHAGKNKPARLPGNLKNTEKSFTNMIIRDSKRTSETDFRDRHKIFTDFRDGQLPSLNAAINREFDLRTKLFNVGVIIDSAESLISDVIDDLTASDESTNLTPKRFESPKARRRREVTRADEALKTAKNSLLELDSRVDKIAKTGVSSFVEPLVQSKNEIAIKSKFSVRSAIDLIGESRSKREAKELKEQLEAGEKQIELIDDESESFEMLELDLDDDDL